MKIILFAACLCGIIHFSNSSEPGVDSDVDSVHEEENLDHDVFNQDLLAGGEDKRRQFKDLSPEDTAKEIRNLIGRIDSNGDEKLDKLELVAWLAKVEDRVYQLEADEAFDKEDKDGDGFITFEEYWSSTQDEEIIPEQELDDAQTSVHIRFREADSDSDGVLDKTEFPTFIHPFRHENMIVHLIEDNLVLYDHNQDGLLSLQEYIRSFSPEEEPDEVSAEWVEEEKEVFQTHLDLNHDGELNYEEMSNWLAPNEAEFFEEEALHLLSYADKDKDGFLTVEEVEMEFDTFIDSPVTDFGHSVHDEL